jgi:hypothetical protein
MSSQIPPARLPHVTLPTIRRLPTIPHIGCAGATGTTYVGQQFGNLPDLHAVLHIKTLKKALDEQIYALIEGKLPDPLRPIPYAARAIQLALEVAQLVGGLAELISGVVAEAESAISFVNQQISELNSAIGQIQSIPEGARSQIQHLMLDRYNRYTQELNAQKSRLQSTIDCVTS